jgi:predicted nucleic acid-binding protein
VTLSEALFGVTRLAIDASALIDYVEKAPRSIASLQKIMERVEAGELLLFGSSVLLTEVLLVDASPGARPLEEYEPALARIERLPVTDALARQAAELRSYYGLSSIDALHLATAVQFSCEALLTCDAHFLRAQGISVSPGKTLKIVMADRLT